MSYLGEEKKKFLFARTSCSDFWSTVKYFNESQILRYRWHILGDSAFFESYFKKIFESLFWSWAETDKYAILQALQTGDISCLGESFIVKLSAEKPSSTNIHFPGGVLTQIYQDLSSCLP